MRRFVEERNWLDAGEKFIASEIAGEGNMNLTLRIKTDRRSVILKQARPWVEKYDHIAAPWDRMDHEQRFYERVASIEEVGGRMPKFLASDAKARAILIEYLADARDYSWVYSGRSIADDELIDLAVFLRRLHDATEGEADPGFANREMRRLNHEHIFVIPLAADNGIDLDAIERGLAASARIVRTDGDYVKRVEENGERYLADGRVLLHGDFFPGSWMETADGPRVIDPEFCFYGDREFDLGVCVGHLALARQRREAAEVFLRAYGEAGEPGEDVCDPVWIARFAGNEIMRRLIGVAQLPLGESAGWRAELLARSAQAVSEESHALLWDEES